MIRLSRTVRPRKMPRPSGMWHTPRAVRRDGLSLVTSSPSISTDPDVGSQQPGDGLQQRRLPGAVRSEERGDRRRGHGEVDAAQDGRVPVPAGDVAELEGGSGVASSRHGATASGLELGDATRRRGRRRARSGWRATAAASPSKMSTPKSSTYMYAQTRITSDMSCSTSRMPQPRSSTTRWRTSPNWAVSSRSRPEDGSSRSSRSNGPARQRASSTSRRWPVDSSPAWRSARSVIPHSSSASAAAADADPLVGPAGDELGDRSCARLARLAPEGHVVEHRQRLAQLHDLERAAEAETGASGGGERSRRPGRGGGSARTTGG